MRCNLIFIWICVTVIGSGVTQAQPLRLVFHYASAGLEIHSGLGRPNLIEYKDNLETGVWKPFAKVFVTHSPYVLYDKIPFGVQRFYRGTVPELIEATAGEFSPPGMVSVPSGRFLMGAYPSDGLVAEFAGERPAHEVRVGAFYMDRMEVTKGLWDEVVSWGRTRGYRFDSPCLGKRNDHPVHSVSWFDALKWCNARSEMNGLEPAYWLDADFTQVFKTGEAFPHVRWNVGFRLPTESEWEGAARGGREGERFPWTPGHTISHERANYYSRPGRRYDPSEQAQFHPEFAVGEWPFTSPVGRFTPNAYGIYDLAGNVEEWCWDAYAGYEVSEVVDPRGPRVGSARVVRGGGWGTIPERCQVSSRHAVSASHAGFTQGFRCVYSPLGR